MRCWDEGSAKADGSWVGFVEGWSCRGIEQEKREREALEEGCDMYDTEKRKA